MELEKKSLCECGGVINGTVINYETGEYPCECELLKKINKKKAKHWENGREKKNAKM